MSMQHLMMWHQVHSPEFVHMVSVCPVFYFIINTYIDSQKIKSQKCNKITVFKSLFFFKLGAEVTNVHTCLMYVNSLIDTS